ncbi:hypothetical protein ACFYXC_16375 [Streptomyces sp. NPDC002701]|uniref:hypothetical protein n=1 Tax=Streptomyces sp. NPDC002701 TaxID=3364661 RepID=UPI003674F5A2
MVLTGIVVLTVGLPLAVASAGPVDGEVPASATGDRKAGDAASRDSASGARDSGGRGAGDPASADRGVRGSASGGQGSEGRSSGESPVSDRADDRGAGSGPAGAASGAAGSAGPRSPLTLGVGLATAARCGPELASPDGIEAQTCVLTQGRDTWARTYYRNATGDDLTSVLTLMVPGDRTVRMHCALGADDEPGVCETPRERTVEDASAYMAVAEFAESADGPLLLRSGSNSPTQKGR